MMIGTEKACYMYTNNQLREVAKNDLSVLLPFVSSRVKEKVNLGLHYLEHDKEETV